MAEVAVPPLSHLHGSRKCLRLASVGLEVQQWPLHHHSSPACGTPANHTHPSGNLRYNKFITGVSNKDSHLVLLRKVIPHPSVYVSVFTTCCKHFYVTIPYPCCKNWFHMHLKIVNIMNGIPCETIKWNINKENIAPKTLTPWRTWFSYNFMILYL